MQNRRWVFNGILVVLLIAFLELCGFLGMMLASHPVPYMTYGDYFKVRKNLLGEAEPDELPRYTPVPSLNYIPTPNFEYAGIKQHNKAGYRGAEVPLAKSDKIRVLFLGGSTTYGPGAIDPDDSYPAQCGKWLNDSSGLGLQFEVINAGVESATSAEELAYYHFKFQYYKPDLVVIHSAGNDALTGPDYEYYQPDYGHYRTTNFYMEPAPALTQLFLHSYFISFISINLYYRNLVYNDFVLTSHGIANPTKWYNPNDVKEDSTISKTAFYNNIDLLLTEIKNDGAQAFVLPFVINENAEFSQNHPEYMKRLPGLNNMLSYLTEKHNAVWVPFKKSSIKDEKSWYDDCHLDVAGEFDKARLVGTFIQQYLKQPVFEDSSTVN